MKKGYIKMLVILALLTALALAPAANAIAPIHNVSGEYLASRYYDNLNKLTLTGDTRTDILLVALSQYGYHVICRYENEIGAYDDEKYKESFSDFYAMLSDKLFDEKCATYEEKITVYDIDRPMISEVKSNKLY
jgi:hypothetical protein